MPEPAVASTTGSRPGRRRGPPSSRARVIAGFAQAPDRPAVTRAATFPVQSDRSASAGEIQRLAGAPISSTSRCCSGRRLDATGCGVSDLLALVT